MHVCAFRCLLFVCLRMCMKMHAFCRPLCDVCALCMLWAYLFFKLCVCVCVCASTQPKAELTDSFPLRSPLVFLIDRHNAKVQALSLVPMLIAGSCIFMSSLGINQLNKGWGRWLGAAFITDSDWLGRGKKTPVCFFIFSSLQLRNRNASSSLAGEQTKHRMSQDYTVK